MKILATILESRTFVDYLNFISRHLVVVTGSSIFFSQVAAIAAFHCFGFKACVLATFIVLSPLILYSTVITSILIAVFTE